MSVRNNLFKMIFMVTSVTFIYLINYKLIEIMFNSLKCMAVTTAILINKISLKNIISVIPKH